MAGLQTCIAFRSFLLKTHSRSAPSVPFSSSPGGALSAYALMRNLDDLRSGVELSPGCRRRSRMLLFAGSGHLQRAYQAGGRYTEEQSRCPFGFLGRSASGPCGVWTDAHVALSETSSMYKCYIWTPVQERCIASLLRNSLRTCAHRPLDIPGLTEPPTLYEDAEKCASVIANYLEAAAAYYRVWLPCQGPAREMVSRPILSCSDKWTPLRAAESGVASSKPTVGLLIPSASLSLLSTLLAVWRCGASCILLPHPGSAAVGDAADGEHASVESTVVYLNDTGATPLAYSGADPSALETNGSNVHGHRYEASQNSSTRNSQASSVMGAFIRQWESYLTESGCSILVASPEVASAVAGVTAKLSVPMCIIHLPHERQFHRLSGERIYSNGKDRERMPVRMYVRHVPHNTRKTSADITRWKALKEEGINETQKQDKSPTPEVEGCGAAMHFYKSCRCSPARVVVYTHSALEKQVLRNKQLLGLTSADSVVLIAAAPTSENSSMCNAQNVWDVNHILGSRAQMTCAPKGLLTIALPAFAAGASLSIITSSVPDCTRDSRLSVMHLQRLASSLPYPRTQQCEEGRCEKESFPSGRPGKHLHGSRIVMPTLAGQKGAQLWNALASMQTEMPVNASSDRFDDTTQLKSPLDSVEKPKDTYGVSLLAMDLGTAAAMVAALQLGEEGVCHIARGYTTANGKCVFPRGNGAKLAVDDGGTSKSMGEGERHFPGEHRLLKECARRYLSAARALRLVCICTDEEDLEYHHNGPPWELARRRTGAADLNTVVYRWQELVTPRVKVLHLCTLSQVGLLFWDYIQGIRGSAEDRTTLSENYFRSVKGFETSRRQLLSHAKTEAPLGSRAEESSFATVGGVVPYDVEVHTDIESGTLKIRSPHGAVCYCNRPRSTAETFGQHGEVYSSLRGRVLIDRSSSVATAGVCRRIVLESASRPACFRRVPLVHRMMTRVGKGPKMERHIEGWVKKRSIAGRDWCNLHASKRHQKQIFRLVPRLLRVASAAAMTPWSYGFYASSKLKTAFRTVQQLVELRGDHHQVSPARAYDRITRAYGCFLLPLVEQRNLNALLNNG